MNICNFAKILITRSTKDKESIKYWNEKNTSTEALENIPNPKYDPTISPAQRHLNYINFTSSCPKMQIPFEKFRRQLPKLEKYITTNSNWAKSNKQQDKTKFIQHFSLYSWDKLSKQQQQKHSIDDCKPCLSNNPDIASLHSSFPVQNKEFVTISENVTNKILENSPPNTKETEKKVEDFVKIFSPIAEKNLGVNLTKTFSKALKLTPKKSYEEKRKTKSVETRTSKEKIVEQLKCKDTDVYHFLGSGKSYKEYDRDRLSSFHISTEEAEESMLKRYNKEKKGKIRPKNHHGNFDAYTFDKTKFLEDIGSMTAGSKVIWQDMARRYNMKNKKGVRPWNGGQILKEFAKANGVDIDRLNLQFCRFHFHENYKIK